MLESPTSRVDAQESGAPVMTHGGDAARRFLRQALRDDLLGIDRRAGQESLRRHPIPLVPMKHKKEIGPNAGTPRLSGDMLRYLTQPETPHVAAYKSLLEINAVAARLYRAYLDRIATCSLPGYLSREHMATLAQEHGIARATLERRLAVIEEFLIGAMRYEMARLSGKGLLLNIQRLQARSRVAKIRDARHGDQATSVSAMTEAAALHAG